MLFPNDIILIDEICEEVIDIPGVWRHDHRVKGLGLKMTRHST